MVLVRRFVTMMVIVAAALALAGCFGASPVPPPEDGDGSQGPVAPDFSRLEVEQLPGDGHTVLYGNQSYTPYTNAVNMMWWATEVYPVLSDWSTSKPSSYSVSGDPTYEVTWSLSGSEFTWEISGGEVPLTVTVEDTGAGFAVTVSESSTTFLSGTVSYDGLEGSVELNDYGGRTATYSWGPSNETGYDIRVDITWSDPQEAYDDTMTVHSTLDGSAGFYQGEENGDSYGPVSWPA